MMDSPSKTDWIGLFALLLMVIGGGVLTFYYTTYEINSCTSDPLKYTINKMTNESYNYVSLDVYKSRTDTFPIASRTIDLELKDRSLNNFFNYSE